MLCAFTIVLGSRPAVAVTVFGREGAEPTVAFLHQLSEIHYFGDKVFLAYVYGCLTDLFRFGVLDQFGFIE